MVVLCILLLQGLWVRRPLWTLLLLLPSDLSLDPPVEGTLTFGQAGTPLTLRTHYQFILDPFLWIEMDVLCYIFRKVLLYTYNCCRRVDDVKCGPVSKFRYSYGDCQKTVKDKMHFSESSVDETFPTPILPTRSGGVVLDID